MPIKSKKIIYELTPDELKEIILQSLGDEIKDSDIDIRFKFTHRDAFDRGPSIPSLANTTVTITRKTVKNV